jgi:Tol biopolymer transport system component
MISAAVLAIIASLLVSCAPSPYPIPGRAILVSAIVSSVLGERSTVLLIEPGQPTESPSRVPGWTGAFPKWSPDGRWIAAIGSQQSGELVLRDTENGMEQTLQTPRSILDLAWAPDSARIAYSTYGDEPGRLLIQWMDVTCIQRAEVCQPESHMLAVGHSVAWSPDGQWIAFAGDPDSQSQGQGEDSIFVLAADGRGEPKLVSADREDCRNPDWSPDGMLVVFSCLFDIYTVTHDGENLTNLTAGALSSGTGLPPWWPRDFMPAWDPSGNRIIFLSERDGGSPLPDEDTRTNGLYAMDPDGGNVVALTPGDEFSIRWYAWTVDR